MTLVITPNRRVGIEEFLNCALNTAPSAALSISQEAMRRVSECRIQLERYVEAGRIIYGVNTSLGGLVNVLVPTLQAEQLQNNLINAVATNVGDYLSPELTRAAMISRIISLARGNSAIAPNNLATLVEMLNRGVLPCIPEKGSLGTSGDLGPLAAIALVGTGQWRAKIGARQMSGRDAMEAVGLEPMKLSYKEGLALINGTSAMVGVGAFAANEARQLLDNYACISALSFEGLTAKSKPFDPRVHRLKPHKGQQRIAEIIWSRLSDSRLIEDEDAVADYLSGLLKDNSLFAAKSIEDAYSIRCTPQILGPVNDTIRRTIETVEDELNSSNDNPLFIADEDDVFHNGHFHGQYISAAMDYLNIALTTMCNLSDRRIDRFLTSANSNGLPPFLCASDPGLRLGLMGGQFMATSLTAETRTLCAPISTQTLTSTADFQDVISLGLVAARRAREILKNTSYVVGFELLCACEAVDIRGPEKLSSSGSEIYTLVRQSIPRMERDLVLTDYLEAAANLVRNNDFLINRCSDHK